MRHVLCPHENRQATTRLEREAPWHSDCDSDSDNDSDSDSDPDAVDVVAASAASEDVPDYFDSDGEEYDQDVDGDGWDVPLPSERLQPAL